MYVHVVFGSPGTGKTHALSDIIVNVELARGVKLSECLITSFTVDASEEIIHRVLMKLGITDIHEIERIKAEMWMGTLHSVCYAFVRQLGFEPSKVMDIKDFIAWAERNNLEHIFTMGRSNLISQETILKYGMIEPQDTPAGVTLQAIEWTKHTIFNDILSKPFNEYAELIFNAPILQETSVKMDFDRLPEYWADYESYKEEHRKIDYSDMLLIAYKYGFIPPTKVMVVDEFHDFSPLKYAIYRKWKESHERTYIALDDDQAIFRFIGASSRFGLIERDIANRVVVLPKTFRLPLTNLAVSMRFIRSNVRPEVREDKWVEPRAKGGIVRSIPDVKDIVAFISKNLQGTGFVLCRTNFHVREITRELFNHPYILVPYAYIRPDAMSVYSTSFVNLINGIIDYEDEVTMPYSEVYEICSRIKPDLLKENTLKILKEKPLPEYPFDTVLSLFKKEMLVDELIMNLKVSEIETSIARKYHAQRLKIELPVKLKIGTIHSAKGLEADTVFLINNITRKIFRSMKSSIEGYEDEARVWYVGMTRAKERLYIINDYFRTGRMFPI